MPATLTTPDGSLRLHVPAGGGDEWTSAVPTGVRFTPDSPLAQSAWYTATVAAVVDYCGHTMTGTHSWTFQTACLMMPLVLPIEVTACDAEGFDLRVGTVPIGSFEWQVLDAAGQVLETVQTIDVNLETAMPYPGQAHSVRVRERDGSGCITPWSEPLALSWEVCYPGPPQVAAVSPPGGSQAVTVTAGLVVTFNEVVYVGAGEVGLQAPALSLAPAGGSEVLGTVEAVAAYDEDWAWSLRLQRAPVCEGCGPVRLAELLTYQALVAGATDAHGNAMAAPYGWTFTTGDFTPPSVVDSVPPAGAFGLPATTVVSAYFGEVLSGKEGIAFDLTGPQGTVTGSLGLEEVPGIGLPDPVGDAETLPEPGGALHFTPTVPLEDAAVYTATVVGATDSWGNQMNTPYVWTFATADTVPFVVEGNSPEAGAVGVPTTATVEIAFSKDLLPGSETTAAFLVQNLGDSVGEAYVPGQVIRLGNVLRFTPDAPLDAGAVYQVYVAGATRRLRGRRSWASPRQASTAGPLRRWTRSRRRWCARRRRTGRWTWPATGR